MRKSQAIWRSLGALVLILTFVIPVLGLGVLGNVSGAAARGVAPTLDVTAPATGTVGEPITIGGQLNNPSGQPVGDSTAGIFADAACTVALVDGTATVDDTGAISGTVTPEAEGPFFVGVTVNVGGVPLTQCLPIAVDAAPVDPVDPTLDVTAPATGTVGEPITIGGQLNNPSGQPVGDSTAGIFADAACTVALVDGTATVDDTGAISGTVTPEAEGPFFVGVTVNVGGVPLTQCLPITITPGQAGDPVLDTNLPTTGTVGEPITGTVGVTDPITGDVIPVPASDVESGIFDNEDCTGDPLLVGTVTVDPQTGLSTVTFNPDASGSFFIGVTVNVGGVVLTVCQLITIAPGASASPAPSFEGDVIEDGVSITGSIQEDQNRAGTFEYFVDTVQAAEQGDLRLAGAGEQEYQVFTVGGSLVDSGFTDANGMVVLDIPADEDYFVIEVTDTGDGSDTIAAGTEANVLAIEYVEDINASASPSASFNPSAPASTAPGGGNGNGAGTGNGTGSGNTATTGGGRTSATSGGGSSTAGGSATRLPNTGAGATESDATMTWAIIALMAIAGVAAAGLSLRRRTV